MRVFINYTDHNIIKGDSTMDNEREVLDTAVHFSFKYVNTNIEAGGVRVGKDKALNVPFICARHLISNYLLLADYTTQMQ